ncbi:MAG: enoyl-CoA hydratase/isomerase family protein [Burkholderiales bacterium]|nr:enoyl-CoA hydratase/isomerase family protein [Burkholderiales bacterium]
MLDQSESGGVLQLRLNRPQRLNALTLALTRELLAAMRQAGRNDAVRAILLTGEGRAFCAGKDRDDAAGPQFVEALQQLAGALMNSPKPVVAAVQGWAVGAGLELMLNCDIVIAGEGARFMLPEVSIGLFGTGGVLALLPHTVGLARAKGALMLGEEFSARDAQQWGLIWSVVEDGKLQDAARATALKLAAADAAVLGQVKALLHRETFGELAGVLERETAAHGRLARR